jgi:hypothetical protein
MFGRPAAVSMAGAHSARPSWLVARMLMAVGRVSQVDDRASQDG